MKITLQILIISMLLFSCQENKKELSKKPDKKEIVSKKKEDFVSDGEKVNDAIADLTIKFSDLKISMSDDDTSWKDEYEETDNIYETRKDTAVFYLDPGYSLERSFKIEQAEFDEIELYGQFEINVGIDTERELDVPFCLIEGWKTYTSEWTKFKVNKNDLQLPMIDERTDHPIDFTIDELKTAVGKHCGPEWLDEIRNIESLDKIRTSFFATRYIYKIKAKNSKTNEVVEKFIVFYAPTSC
ncbi:hypothetical protein J2Y38_004064 [Flavobacterium sp. 2755]|uniref:hypothetical protein n=1 Tax=Flavobacterium sp. 2755 TaxID=2817765 RepID=UPI00285A4A35|nr:hypothetical protein [Flavobacterium sp. 2755]MDR6763840.1 hypothetical protein [Flavobacterium sp. 2755]